MNKYYSNTLTILMLVCNFFLLGCKGSLPQPQPSEQNTTPISLSNGGSKASLDFWISPDASHEKIV